MISVQLEDGEGRAKRGEEKKWRRETGGKKNRREEGSLFLEISDSSHP